MKWLKWIGIIFAVLLIVPVVTLVALGHRASAGQMNIAVEINATPENIWTWIDDGEKLKQWVSWLVDVKYPDAQMRQGLGATRVWVMKDENNGGMLMQIVGKCHEYAPPTRMAVSLSSPEGYFDGEQDYRLVSLGNGHTRMEIHSQYHFAQWFANLMEPLIMPQATKKMQADVAHLKRLVEASAALQSAN